MRPAAPVETPEPPGRNRGAGVPRWVKLGVKVALTSARLPAPLLRRAGINRHSFAADDPARIVAPLVRVVERFRAVAGRAPRNALELGPARMVARAPVAAALGLSPVLYLDVEDDAPRDLAPYLAAAELARAAGLAPPDLAGATTREAVLARCGATLLLGGPEALAAVPDGSVDLVFSEAVFEHIRRDAVPGLLAALARVTAPDGLHIHDVDLRDHLGGGQRHLGFPAALWEGRAIARCGIYTNRLGATAWLAALRGAGLDPAIAEAAVWDTPPGPRIHPDTGYAPDDARIAGMTLEARPQS